MNKKITYKNGDINQKYQGDISIISNCSLKNGLKFKKLEIPVKTIKNNKEFDRER